MAERRNWVRFVGMVWLLWLAPGACGGKSDPGSGTEGSGTGGTTVLQGTGGGVGIGGTITGIGGTIGSYTSCAVDADCTWTEITVEILKPADCMCLFGCPYLLVNTTTASRRSNQFTANCTYGRDGKGNPCPIDDCVSPPVPHCSNGTCISPTN
jgi:hypothetical protein